MQPTDSVRRQLEALGLHGAGPIHYNLTQPELVGEALARGEGRQTAHGVFVARTTPHTGRSPLDRFVVDEPSTHDRVGWGDVNVGVPEEVFDGLLARMGDYAAGRPLFVLDAFAGADPDYRLGVRVITEKAWHSAFAHNMFIQPGGDNPQHDAPDFTVLDLCDFEADPARDGTRSSTFIILHLARRLVIIGGTRYGGEIKKSVFSALNYLLPEKGVLPMHCSANTGGGVTAIFFGLSGTGKTTLSADASRTLVGDDEHGWSEKGVYNFEGGCYAKTIHLSPEGEPEIYQTTRMPGTILENVVLDAGGVPDFADDTLTENTRAAYPIAFIPNASESGEAGHPQHVIFLTADAFGVLPPVARLTTEGAMYQFLSGYTAKVAGTERGVKEPKATFSACFGEPFMVRPPAEYARMLGQRIRQHGARCWLVNTGWTGGPYGVGSRFKLAHTRAIVNAILRGDLDGVPTRPDPFFGLEVPAHVPGVPDEMLTPSETWEDREAYAAQARRLQDMFAQNFRRYGDAVSADVAQAGPHPARG